MAPETTELNPSPPQEFLLEEIDPKVILDHLGESWSLAIEGEYKRPERYTYFVKTGWTSTLRRIIIEYGKTDAIVIEEPEARFALNHASSLTLLEGGNLQFKFRTRDGEKSFDHENRHRSI